MLMARMGKIRAHGTNNPRTLRWAVGRAGPTAAAPAAAHGPAAQRPPAGRRSDRVAGPRRRAVAGPARPLWALGDGGQPLLPLAPPGRVGPGPGLLAGRRRCPRRAGLAAALCRRVGGAGPPARRGGQAPARHGRPGLPAQGGLPPILTSRSIWRRWAAAAAATQ